MEDNDDVARLQTRLNALKEESMLMLQEEQRLKIIQKEMEVKRLQEEMASQADRARRKQQRLERQERRKELFGDEEDANGISAADATGSSRVVYGPSGALNSPLPADEPRCPALSHQFAAHPTQPIIYCVKCGRIENI